MVDSRRFRADVFIMPVFFSRPKNEDDPVIEDFSASEHLLFRTDLKTFVVYFHVVVVVVVELFIN